MAKPKGITVDPNEVKKWYYQDKISTTDIAKRLGVCTPTARYWMIKCGIELRSQEVGFALASYKLGAQAKGKSRIFSSEWKENISKSRRASADITAKGYSKKATGYVVITRGPNKHKFQHRVVMESILNRPITEDEHVHHVNGVKWDNRPENLVVMQSSEHLSLHGKARAANGLLSNLKHYSGEDHPSAKLTSEDVSVIRSLQAILCPVAEISEIFEVSRSCIKHILKRRTWKDLN